MNSGKLSRRQPWAKSLIKLRERCNDYPYAGYGVGYAGYSGCGSCA